MADLQERFKAAQTELDKNEVMDIGVFEDSIDKNILRYSGKDNTVDNRDLPLIGLAILQGNTPAIDAMIRKGYRKEWTLPFGEDDSEQTAYDYAIENALEIAENKFAMLKPTAGGNRKPKKTRKTRKTRAKKSKKAKKSRRHH